MTLTVILLALAMPQARVDSAKQDAVKPDAMVCRSYAVLGSRAKRERVCRTAAQWQGLDDEQRRVGTEVVERSRLTTITK